MYKGFPVVLALAYSSFAYNYCLGNTCSTVSNGSWFDQLFGIVAVTLKRVTLDRKS